MDAKESYETAEHLFTASPEKAIEILEVIGMQIISCLSIILKSLAVHLENFLHSNKAQ